MSFETQPDAPPQPAPDERQLPDFHISASVSLQERQPHTLKHGDTFAVFDHRGDIGADPRSPEGIYHLDTRILSRLELLLEGYPPLLLSSMNQDDNAVFTADLSNPDLLAGDRIVLRREQFHLHRLKFIWNARLLRAAAAAQLQRGAAAPAAETVLCRRFRRPVRGARREARAPRHGLGATRQRRRGDAALHGPG